MVSGDPTVSSHSGIRWGRSIERRQAGSRYGIVLLLLLATFVFRASAPTGDWVPLATVLIQGLTLLAALAAAEASKRLVRIALIVIALGVIAGIVSLVTGSSDSRGYVSILSFLLVAVAPVAIVDVDRAAP